MTQALEAAKQARDRGANVLWARTALKEARSAFEQGNYASAMERADFILAQFGFGPEQPAAVGVPPAGPAQGFGGPASTDLGAAAGRLAEATESVKRAKARGFNVRVARAALKEAKRAYKARNYGKAIEYANQAIQSCGSSARI